LAVGLSLFVNVIAQAAISGAQPVNLSKALRRNDLLHIAPHLAVEPENKSRLAAFGESHGRGAKPEGDEP
jgi:hypothetical protein